MLVLTSASLHELLGYYGKKSVSKQIINVKRQDVLNGIFDQTTLNQTVLAQCEWGYFTFSI